MDNSGLLYLNMVGKKAIETLLKKKWRIFPICIPSYKRWDRKDNKTLTSLIENCSEEVQKNTYVFVRKEQAELYKENYQTVNIVVLPEVNGLAGTRQFIQDFVIHELNQPYYIDMDDDITGLRYIFHEEGKDRVSQKNESDPEQILRLGCAISTMAFELDHCVLGNFHRSRFANNYPASQTAYRVNKGSTPRQITFVNARGLYLRKVQRNLEFDETGDDVGFVAEIAKKRLDMFQIPCLAYKFVDDAVNSVIRNDENRKRLAQQEYSLLKRYPMKDYLKITQTFEDGSYRFSDIDYGAYRAIANRPAKDRTLEQFVQWTKDKMKRKKR